ncbi:MAG: Uma2 family endonuclease [Fimbriiglobus sp.]
MKAVIASLPEHWAVERSKSDAAQWDEMWDGVLHMPPMPNRMHQDFELDLAAHLKRTWAKPRGCRVHHEVNLTTPEDEHRWTKNYRIPDLVLLSADRFRIDRGEYMAGAPLVVVEIRSPGDETYEKFEFYAGLGVPEVWVFDRDTKAPEVHELAGIAYKLRSPDADGWLRSPASGVEFRHVRPGSVRVRVAGDDATAADLPEE